MTEQQALDLAEQIRQEEGERIQVKVVRTRNSGPKKTALRLVLVPGQRSILVVHPREWKGIRDAWRQIYREVSN
jgi:hypothetical protein